MISIAHLCERICLFLCCGSACLCLHVIVPFYACVFNTPLLVCRHWDTNTLASSGMHVLIATEERDRVMGSLLRGRDDGEEDDEEEGE